MKEDRMKQPKRWTGEVMPDPEGETVYIPSRVYEKLVDADEYGTRPAPLRVTITPIRRGRGK